MSVKTAALSKPMLSLHEVFNSVQTLASAALVGSFDDDDVMKLEAEAINNLTYVVAYLQAHADKLD